LNFNYSKKFQIIFVIKNGFNGFGHNHKQKSYGSNNFIQSGYQNRDMRFNMGGYEQEMGFNMAGFVDPYNNNNNNPNVYRTNNGLSRYTGSSSNLVPNNPSIQRLQNHLSNSYREPFSIQHSNSTPKLATNNHYPNVQSNRLVL
jgi:hypothetical protein